MIERLGYCCNERKYYKGLDIKCIIDVRKNWNSIQRDSVIYVESSAARNNVDYE